jgi:CRP/FNR family cyclic AMP-dependent transcriptional regulator
MAHAQSLIETYGLLAERCERPAALRGGTMAENKVWYLKQNRLFAQATDEQIENCEHIFKTTLFPKRAAVFDLGDPTRLVYLIKRGKVRIARLTPDGKEVTVAVLGAGDMFGEETLFDAAARSTIAICIEESLLCTAKADDLFGLLSRNPALALNVARILSDRLGDASATMEDLAYARVPDRLMHLFARLAGEHGVEAGDRVELHVRLTHADIASLIGSSRETVSLEMANLVRAGRIASDGRTISIPKAELGK